MAWSLVQNKGAASNAATFTAGPTQNNLLVACIRSASLVSAVGLPAGWSTAVSDDESTTGTIAVIIAYKIAGAGESSTVTFTGTTAPVELEIMEFTGGPTVSPLDTTNANDQTGLGTSAQPGSITPATGADLMVAMVGTAAIATEAIDSSYNTLDIATFSRMIVAYKIKTDALAENPTFSWTTSSGRTAIHAAFKGGTAYTSSPTDTATSSDANVKTVGAPKTDSVTSSEVATKTAVFRRTVADTATPSEANVKTVATPKTDSVTSSEANTKTYTAPKTDSVTSSEANVKTVTAPKTDSVTVSESARKTVGHPATDSVTSSDASTRNPVTHPADTVTSGDTATRTVTFSRTITDTATAGDAAPETATFLRALTDTATATDTPAKLLTLAFSDQLGTTETVPGGSIVVAGGGGGAMASPLPDWKPTTAKKPRPVVVPVFDASPFELTIAELNETVSDLLQQVDDLKFLLIA